MPFISDNLIEKTWQHIGGFGANEIQKLLQRHRKAQNALTMYANSRIHEFREDAFGVLLYVFHVVIEASANAKPRPKRVSKHLINSVSKDKKTEIPFSIDLVIERSSEPAVIKYVYEAFTECDDVVLSMHEMEAFLVTMETVVESLHQACTRS